MSVTDVVLVGSSALHRDGVRHSLDSAHFSVIGEGRDFESVLALVGAGVSPRLIVADVSRLSEKDLEDLRRVRDTVSDCRIVVLSNNLDLIDLRRVFRAGADGFLVTELSREAFSLALLLVVNGEKVLPGALADVLASNCESLAASIVPKKVRGKLTGRERQILRCLLNGDSNKAIARALEITEGTVKVHLKTLMKKISATNRTQAALWARGQGMGADLDPMLLAARSRSERRSPSISTA
jgi:two-component system, NarL family, nitrate/nitrite response regulator NarL